MKGITSIALAPAVHAEQWLFDDQYLMNSVLVGLGSLRASMAGTQDFL